MTTKETRRPRAWHWLALAAWPPLALSGRYPGEAPARDVAVAFALTIGGAAIVFLVLRLLTRRPLKAALVTSLLVVAFFAYAAIHDAAWRLTLALGWDALLVTPIRHRYVMLLTLVLVAIPSVLILASRRDLAGPTRFVNLLAGLLLVFAALPLGRHALTRRTPADEGVAVTAHAPAPPGAPDIYYVILDRYPNRGTLETSYGFDNDAFLDELRRRGFQIAPDSHANYSRSCLSLASSLEMDYLPQGFTQSEAIYGIHEGPRVPRLLKANGYRYVHIGSLYYGTGHCRLADANPHPAVGVWSEFATALVRMTPLENQLFSRVPDLHAEGALFQFRKLEECAGADDPTFVFAHFLLPHPPFVFDRRGERVAPGDVHEDWKEASKTRFIEQLEFVNTRVLAIVDRILAESRRPPVIILQADEGPWLRGRDRDLSYGGRLRVRTGILNACYLPGVEPGRLSPSATPVNTFRLVLSEYLGVDLPPLEDRVFSWTGMQRPMEADPGIYEFEDVTHLVER